MEVDVRSAKVIVHSRLRQGKWRLFRDILYFYCVEIHMVSFVAGTKFPYTIGIDR